jgi:hypothetical protein
LWCDGGEVGEWIEIELVEEPARQRRVAPEPAVPKQPHAPSARDGRNRRRAGVAAAVAVAVGIGWAVTRSGGDVSTSAPPTTPEEAAATTAQDVAADTTQAVPPTTRQRVTTTTAPAVVVEELGGPLVANPTGLSLVALTARGDLLELDVDTGQMTTTQIPGSNSGGGATIVAGGDWAMVQPWNANSSFVVPQGATPVDITSSNPFFGGVFRGPDPDTLWMTESNRFTGAVERLNLVGLDGEPLGRSIDLRGWWPSQSDLAGGVVVQAGGGIYVVSEAGARRVADGELVGAGLNHFLVRACDEALACGLFLIDRATGERRQVPVIQVDGLAQYYGWTGTDSASISPDGSAAILFGLDGDGQVASLLGTGTGVYRSLTRMTDSFSVAWSADSRYVVYTDSQTLKVYDITTGEETSLDAVPPITSFAARP